jgi:hypothetical protein
MPANEVVQGVERGTCVALGRSIRPNTGSPTGREAQGDGVAVVVRERESRPHGEGPQVSDDRSIEVAGMAIAKNIRVIYSDLSEEWHWKAGRHRKSHIRFGEGVPEKCHVAATRRLPTLRHVRFGGGRRTILC